MLWFCALIACLPTLTPAPPDAASDDTGAASDSGGSDSGTGDTDSAAPIDSGETAVDTDTGAPVDTGPVSWDGTYQGTITATATRYFEDTGAPPEALECEGSLILVVALDSAAPVTGSGRCDWTTETSADPLQFVFSGEERAGDSVGGENEVYWTPEVQFEVSWQGEFSQPAVLSGTTAGGDAATTGIFFDASFTLERL